MGAAMFVLNADETEKKQLSFSEKQRIYSSEKNILNNQYLSQHNFRDDISRFISSNLSESDIKDILEKYNPHNKGCKITGLKYPKETILLYATGLIIENNQLIEKNIDIFKYVQNIYQSLVTSEDELEKCRAVEERFQKEFEMDLKLLKYDISKGIFQRLSPTLYSSFNLNFALKEVFQPNIITVILNEQILTKVELIESLAEVIKYNTKLQIVNFFLIPKDNNGVLLETFGLDGLMFTMLYKLIEAVSLNRAIKSFILHSVKDYSIILAPEISNLIIKKLQSETLIFLHIGNISLSTEFNKKLIFQFSSTRSLLFVSIEDKYFSKDNILPLKSVLSQNKSILALSIISPLFKNMKPEIINKFKSTLQEGSKLEIVHLNSQSLFSSFINENIK
jgi:hypothetical protein